MSRVTRPTAVLLSCLALLVLGASALAAQPAGKADRGTAWLSITHTVGKVEYADGDYRDKRLGTGAVNYRVDLLPSGSGTLKVVAKTVVLYTATGSLRGTGSATVTFNATGTVETITNGKLRLKKGSGSLAGHSLVATFTGTANLSANALVFHYSGTFR